MLHASAQHFGVFGGNILQAVQDHLKFHISAGTALMVAHKMFSFMAIDHGLSLDY
jgi:hypothetical protein